MCGYDIIIVIITIILYSIPYTCTGRTYTGTGRQYNIRVHGARAIMESFLTRAFLYGIITLRFIIIPRAYHTRTMGTRPADKNLRVPTGAAATARACMFITSIILYIYIHLFLYVPI